MTCDADEINSVKANYCIVNKYLLKFGTGNTAGRSVDEFTGVIAAQTKRMPPAKKRIRRQSGAKKVTSLLQIALRPRAHARL